VVRPDPYHWLRDAGAPDVLAHLGAERRWYDSVVGHRASLIEDLRSEMVQRTPTTDSSARCVRRHFSYYVRVPTGREHPQLLQHLNRVEPNLARNPYPGGQDRNDSGGVERVILDAGDLAGDSAYVELGLTAVSPDEGLLAYSYDVRGDEVYRLRFRDLRSGEDLPDDVPRTYYGGAWSEASDSFLYTRHDQGYRPFQVWRHRIGSTAGDELVLEEADPRFEIRLRQCRSGRLAVVWAVSPDTTEVWVVDLTRPGAPARSVGGRREGVKYHAEHAPLPDGEDVLLVVTDEGARESRLVAAPVPREVSQDHTTWRELVPEDPAVRLERADAFEGHVVLSVRTDGERRLRLLTLEGLLRGDGAAPGLELRPRFSAGTVHLGPNPLPDTGHVVVADGSYVHPWV
jgi:oligopeptidase B